MKLRVTLAFSAGLEFSVKPGMVVYIILAALEAEGRRIASSKPISN